MTRLETDATVPVLFGRGPTASHAMRRRHGLVTMLCIAALGASPSACSSDPLATGWEVVCLPGAEPEDQLPGTICLSMTIEGGASPDALRAACAQEHNKYYGENLGPQDFPGAFIPKDDDAYWTCYMQDVPGHDAHPFPVWEISGAGGQENPNLNAIQCHPIQQIEITDGDGSYKEPTLAALRPCAEPGWSEADELAACSAQCQAWTDLFPDYPLFVVDENHGDCDVDNFTVEDIYLQECMADEMGGSILAASAQLVFSDPLNWTSGSGTGALLYDDSMCGPGGPCEPELLMTFSAGTAVHQYVDAAGAPYDLVLTNARLRTLQPARTLLDPASGALGIPEMELEVTVEDVLVDGVSVGPLATRQFMSPVSVAYDRTGMLTLTGGVELLGGQLNLVVTADPRSSTQWPAD